MRYWNVKARSILRRQGGQRQRGEGVHDEVHPEHLRDGEGGFRAQECADEHNEAGRHVNGHLEDDEADGLQYCLRYRSRKCGF